jgi:hypothetical protein
MKKELRIVLSAVASLMLVAGVCALPVTLPHNTTHEQAVAEPQSVSGKIASIGKSSFTLTVGASHAISDVGQQAQDQTPKSMTFRIDKNTTVDGSLQVGANADVTYREDAGSYLAISVRVS